MRTAWIDASCGVAGDMVLAAAVDAGAAFALVCAAVEAVAPAEVRMTREVVVRAGMRATRIGVTSTGHDHAHRTWHDVRALIGRAALADPVREDALAVFARLAAAEARVHGVGVDDVRFHEVGAWDSIADVVGVCAAFHDLGVRDVVASPVAVGSGRVWGAHGELPVPVPAVAELAVGWRIFAGGEGELATPTGMALVTTLAGRCDGVPAMRVHAAGVGAGGRDTPGRPNVVRVLVGEADAGHASDEAVVLETNVDDLDPRAWPGVTAALLAAGASDAWLVPILMKKGRPAHTLRVLCPPELVGVLRDVVFGLTGTLGVRQSPVRKTALDRGWVSVDVLGAPVPIKIGHRAGVVVVAMPEFEDAAARAVEFGVPVRVLLDAARAAAHAAGLVAGAAVPDDLGPVPAA